MFTLFVNDVFVLNVPLPPVKTEPPIVMAFAFKNKRPFKETSPATAKFFPKDTSLETNNRLLIEASPTIFTLFVNAVSVLNVPLPPVKTEPPIVMAFAFKNKRPFKETSPATPKFPPKDASLVVNKRPFKERSSPTINV